MRSANPALNKYTFRVQRMAGEASMTVDGTVNKTALGLILLMTTAIFSWNNPEIALSLFQPISILTLILLLITIINKRSAPFIVPIYCLAEGIFLGGLSAIANMFFPGIANTAIAITFGILAALLFLYKSKLVAATENFKLGLFSATLGVAFIYFLYTILGLFGVELFEPLFSNGLEGILFSVFVIGIGSMNLVLDFDFIENGAEIGAPKYMEWYATFALMVTLIWLYLEVLNLLMKLRSRR